MKRASITIALIVKNEAHDLRECLESIKDIADEIVIVDSGSTDDTESIAREYTDKFYVNTDWQGFGAQRRLAQTYVSTDWIFWIDADERFTPELKASISQVLNQPIEPIVYEVARLNRIFGQDIKHSGWYHYIERFYPTQLTQYNQALVHESVEIPAGITIKKLSGDLIHYTYKDVFAYLRKMDEYSKAWAQERFAKNKKCSIWTIFSHSLSRFIRMYFINRGFLDGKAGLAISLMAVYSVFGKYLMLWLLNQEKKSKS